MGVSLSSDEVYKNSSLFVDIVLLDENRDITIPNSITWTLTNIRNEIINLREDVSITPASSMTIVLSGDDLTLPESTDGVRKIIVSAIYNSNEANNLPVTGISYFTVIGD